jgi:O-antigen ligase
MSGPAVLAAVLGMIAAAAALPWFVRDPRRGLYAAIFASAVLLAPRFPVVRDKLAACEIAVLFTWLALLFAVRRTRPPLLEPQRATIWQGGLLLAACVLSLWVNAAVDNLQWERSLVETANYTYGFLLFATVVCLIDSWDAWFRCLVAWCWGSALVSAVALLSMCGRGPAWARDEFTGRVSATLKFSNQLPGYCIPVLALVLLLAARQDTRPGRRVALLALAAGIMLAVLASGSRMGLLMVVFCLGGTFCVGLFSRCARLLDRRLMLALGSVLVAAAGWWLYQAQSAGTPSYALGKTPAIQRSARMAAEWLSGKRSLDSTRAEQFHTIVDRFFEHPVWGIGPANFTIAYRTHEIHNTYAGVLAEEGVLGLGTLMLWLVAVVHAGRAGLQATTDDDRRLIVLAMLIGFAALLMYGCAMFGLRQRPFWFLCGLMAALPRVAAASRAPATRAARRRVSPPLHSCLLRS